MSTEAGSGAYRRYTGSGRGAPRPPAGNSTTMASGSQTYAGTGKLRYTW